MILVQILSVSSLIIGLYILFMILFSPNSSHSPPQTFHLGCFLIQHPISHYNNLTTSLTVLQKKSPLPTSSKSMLPKMDLIQQQSLQAALSFEIFMNDYARKREEMRNYFQLSKATKSAYQHYRQCQQQLSLEHYQEANCRNLWIDYQNCTQVLSVYKMSVSELLDQKQEIQYIMSDKIDKVGGSKSDSKKPTINENQRRYRLLDKELELEEKTIEASIKALMEKKETTKYNYEVAKNETLNSIRLYHECSDHRKEFKECQELSAEVRNLGHGTLDSLADKLDRKRISIMKIQGMLQGEQTQEGKDALIALYNRSLIEYKKLHKIFAEIKAKIVKNCGCTQKEQNNLFITTQVHKKSEQTIRLELYDLEQTLERYRLNLAQTKQKRKQAFLQFQEEQRNKLKNNTNQLAAIYELQVLESQQAEIKQKIFNYQTKFEKLSLSCEANKQELSKMLSILSLISDCRNKRQYYQGLQTKLQKYQAQADLEIKSKGRLILALNQFMI